LLEPSAGDDVTADNDRIRALAAFKACVPVEIARVAEPFPSHQWSLMVLLRFSRFAAELAASNPALAYALANNSHIRETASRSAPFRTMLNIRKKQREICEQLGFPGTDATVRILQKLAPEACSPPVLRLLRITLSNPQAIKLLGHLKHINRQVVYLVTREDIFRLVTPRLLTETSESDADIGKLSTSEMLSNIVYHTSRMQAPPGIPGFTSTQHVVDFHDAIARAVEDEKARIAEIREQLRLAQELRDRHALEQRRLYQQKETELQRKRDSGLLVFPPPPLPGTEYIKPITNHVELKEEGKLMHHCVGGYSESVENGRRYVYRVFRPERATLSIACGRSGVWRLDSMRCACNQPASDATYAAVMEWLDQFNIHRRIRGLPGAGRM
jgi:hypothetical protein